MSIKRFKPTRTSGGFLACEAGPKMNVCRTSRRLSVRLNLDVWRSTTNRNEPQVHRVLNTFSPFDIVLRPRLRMTVGEALGEQSPLIIVRRLDVRAAHDRETKTQSPIPLD